MADSSSTISLQPGCGAGGGIKFDCNIALVYKLKVFTALGGSPNLKRIISPCSVTRKPLLREPGGCDNNAALAGAPPLPVVPPRPWNNVGCTPASLHTFNRASCARYCAHEAAITPASFAESE